MKNEKLFIRIKEKQRIYYSDVIQVGNIFLIPHRGGFAFRNDGYIVSPDPDGGVGRILFSENGNPLRWK
jgi:hypothetical protein